MEYLAYKAYNREDGIQAEVTAGHLGYHVVLFDLDAGEYVQTAKCFDDFNKAREYADYITGANA